MPDLDRSPSGVTVTKDVQVGGNCAVGLRRSDVVARDCVRRENAVRALDEREGFIDEAALPWTLRDAASLSRMGVCAFAPSVWRLQREGASVLRAGGLRGARFQSEAATGEAFFLEAGGRGWTLPRCRMTLAGIGPARRCPSGRRPQRGCASCCKVGIGSSRRPASVLDGRAPRVLLAGGHSGGVVLPEGRKPAAVASEPEGRRWRWPSRVRRCTTVAFSPEAATRVLGRPRQGLRRRAVCIELGSPCLCLPDRCASERALRTGWRWTAGARRGCGGGGAAWSRPVGRRSRVHPFAWEVDRGVPFASAGGWVSACACIQVGGRRGEGGLPSVPEGGAGFDLWAG